MPDKSPVRSSEFQPPICACGRVAELVTGESVYPHRPDLASKSFWKCPQTECDSYVGTHPGTHRPLGILANLELRNAKILAHAWFDRRWRTKMARTSGSLGRARKREYAWLAREMGMPFDECHIGGMSTAQCMRVVEVCRAAEKATASSA